MATPINATILHIKVDGTKITHQLNADFKVSTSMRESLTKDNSGYKNKFPGKKDWELSGEAEIALDAAYGWEELFDAFMAGGTVELTFTTDVATTTQFIGDCIITELSTSAGVEENARVSYTFTGNGTLVKS